MLLRKLLGRLARAEADATGPLELTETLQLTQVASMLQLEEIIPELIALWQQMASGADVSELKKACERLEPGAPGPCRTRDSSSRLQGRSL